MNPAYKHLDTKLKVHELTISQWLGVVAGLGIALLWALYVSPFGLYPTLISSIYIGGLPAGATFVASVSEFDLWLLMRSGIRWRRDEGCFVPGAGPPSDGYVVEPDPTTATASNGRPRLEDIDIASLWEES